MRAQSVILVVLAMLTASALASSPAKLVYRIDHATAAVKDNRLIIAADGAVRTGGWQKPKLHLREIPSTSVDTLEVTFEATPPSPGEPVVRATLPVSAKLDARLPRQRVTRVKIVSETNSVTVAIAP